MHVRIPYVFGLSVRRDGPRFDGRTLRYVQGGWYLTWHVGGWRYQFGGWWPSMGRRSP